MISYHTAIFPKYEIKKEKGDQMLYEYNMVSNFDPCIDMYQFYIRFTITEKNPSMTLLSFQSLHLHPDVCDKLKVKEANFWTTYNDD